MRIEDLKNFKNGTTRKVVITRPVEVMTKLIKANPELAKIQIVKTTKTVARIGVAFENMKGYEKPAAAEDGSTTRAKGATGHYLDGERNRVLETSTGKIMVCLKKGPNSKFRGEVTWTLNGVPCKYEDVEKYLYAKDKYNRGEEEKKELLGYMVALENLTVLPATYVSKKSTK